MNPLIRDALLTVTKALPNGVASTTSDAIDLGHSANGQFLAPCELLLETPDLATADLGDAATMTYQIIESANADLSAPTVVATLHKATQTGAGGVGAVGGSTRYRIPTDAKRYLGVKATNSAAGDASDKSFTASLVF